jgi:hypothetical protein
VPEFSNWKASDSHAKAIDGLSEDFEAGRAGRLERQRRCMDQKAIDSLIAAFVTDWGFPDSGANAEFESDLRALIDKVRPPPPRPIPGFAHRPPRRITFEDE